MEVFGNLVVRAVHPDVAHVFWGEGEMSERSPLEPVGRGVLAAAVYVVDPVVAGQPVEHGQELLFWVDASGQRVYLPAVDRGRRDGVPHFDVVVGGVKHKVAFYGADEEVLMLRQAKYGELRNGDQALDVSEIPYIITELAMASERSLERTGF